MQHKTPYCFKQNKTCSWCRKKYTFNILSQHRAGGVHRPAFSPVCSSSKNWEISIASQRSSKIWRPNHCCKGKLTLPLFWRCGGWAMVHDTVQLHCRWKKLSKNLLLFLCHAQFVNSQARVWGKCEEYSGCFLQCESGPKSFNPSKIQGNGSLGSNSPLRQVVPTPRKCSSFWSTVLVAAVKVSGMHKSPFQWTT